MNNSFTPRRWAVAVLMMAFVALTNTVMAQCGDFITAPLPATTPIPININVTDGGGTQAVINNAVMTSYGFSIDIGCRYQLSQDPTFSAGNINVPQLGGSVTIGGCADIGMTKTWYVRVINGIGGAGGPSVNKRTLLITVFDNILPTITCPGNVMGNTDPGFCTRSVPLSAVANDNCPAGLTYTWATTGAGSVPASGTGNAIGIPFNKGVSTVTYTAKDASNNTRTCTFTVTVNDAEAPVLTCPANITVGTSSNGTGNCDGSAGPTATNPVTAMDNCPGAVLTRSYAGATNLVTTNGAVPANTTFNIGVTTVTYGLTDAAGNPSVPGTCNFTITVEDDEDPILNCPADATVTLSAPSDPMLPCGFTLGTQMNLTATPTDNCDGTPVIWRVSSPSSLFGLQNLNGVNIQPGVAPYTDIFLGLNTIIWEAEDAAGNNTTCEVFLNIEDNAAPEVSNIPIDIYNVFVTPGDCSKVLTIDQPDFDDVIANDCTLPITLERGDVIVNGALDANLFQFVPFVPTSNPPVTPKNLATVQFPVGETKIEYVWIDGAGNRISQFITVNVEEDVPPTAICVSSPLIIPMAADGQTNISVEMINNGSTDNCGGANGINMMTLSKDNFQCSDVMPATIVLTVTDNAGNTSTCSTLIDVIDVTAPETNCPSVVVKAAGANCQLSATSIPELNLVQIGSNAPFTAPGQYRENCGTPTVTYALTGSNFTGPASGAFTTALNTVVFNAGVTPITFSFVDSVGNSSACNFNVSIVDQQAPKFANCPLNTVSPLNDTLTLNANTGGCTAAATWTDSYISFNATDNCSPATNIAYTRTHVSGSFFPFGNTTVTYSATDAAGNVGTCSFVVKVVDTQAPVARCKNIDALLDAMGNVTKLASDIDDNTTDNCFYDYGSPSSYSFNCTTLGPNTVTLKVVDGSGNTSTCTAIITVKDTEKPVANCKTIGTINLNAAGQFVLNAFDVNNLSTDNTFSLCDPDFKISVDGSTPASAFTFSCSALGNRTLTFTVTDKAGNSSTCSQVVNVKDVTPPTFTKPGDLVISCEDNNTPAFTGNPSNVFDACTSGIVPTKVDIITPGSCPQELTIQRVWTATDASGNSATQTQFITIEDNDAPTVAMYTEQNLQTNSQTDCFVPFNVEITGTNISDNCATGFGAFKVSYTVNYPAPYDAAAPFLDKNTKTLGAVAGTQFPIGTTTIVFYVEDPCGNETSHTIAIKVVDKSAPKFEATYSSNFCGKTITLNNTTGDCSNTFSWTRPNNALGIVFDCSTPVSVTEAVSNLAVQNVLNTTIPFDFNLPATFSNFNRIFPTAQFPVGKTTVTYTATDAANNVSTCSFIVEVTDSEKPKLSCPPTQTFTATCPTAQLPDYRNLVVVTDNCPNSVVLKQTPTELTTLGAIFAPNLPKAGDELTVKVVGNDLYLKDSCTFIVKLVDGQAPVPSKASLPDLVSYCGNLIVQAPEATDPCNPNSGIIYGTPSIPVVQLPSSTPPKYVFGVGQYAVNWQYKDASGNISFQPQTIKIFADVYPPVAKCKLSSNTAPIIVNLDGTGNAKLKPIDIDNGSADTSLCDGLIKPVTLLLNDSTFNCADLATNMGKQVITLQAKDINGNTATCSATIQVKDITAPVLSPIPANVTIEACAAIPAPATITAADICTNPITPVLKADTTQTPTGVGKYNYTITRTWTATDASGNSAKGTQIITIKDSKAPVFAANTPVSLTFNTTTNNTDCKATVNYNVRKYLSDCATGNDVRVTTSPAGFTLSDTTEQLAIGTYTYVFTAKDTTGNISKDTVTFIVKDATLPTAVCINGISVALQASGTVIVGTSQINANSFDNCTIDSLKIQRLTPAGAGIGTPAMNVLFSCPDADGVTKHSVKLFVKDKAGNESTCQTFVVVQDNVKPTITTCPASKTLQCTDDLSPAKQGTPVATDNCFVKPATHVDSLKAGTGNICTVVRRFWSVSDQANNVTTCLQTLSVQDTVKPKFATLPASANLSCEDPLVAVPTVTATDNCDNLVEVTLKTDTINVAQGACGKFSYTLKRTWTAKDDCGNTLTHVQNVTVTDTKKPQFLGLPDTIRVFSANFPPNLNCTVPVDVELGQYLKDCTADTSMVVTHNFTQFAPNGLRIKGNFPVGNYKVILSATDACGNIGKDTFELRVIDNSLPTLICNNNLVVALGSGATATITAADIDQGSTDNCVIASRTLSKTSFNCSDIGDVPVSLTVKDVNGNSNVCNVVVKVTLGINPGIVINTIDGIESFFGAKDGTVSATASNGTGTYTYKWSNNATTATVANLAAGVYTVTVTDTGNNCKNTATATVKEGPKVTLKVGQGAGAQNSIVTVPVTADHFIKIYSASFSHQVVNNLVGTVIGVTDINPALTAAGTFTGTATGATWITSNPITPLTIANGAELFKLRIQLTNAPVGSTSVVRIFDGTPSLEVLQDSAGTPKATMVALMDGSVTINSGSQDLKVGGDIETWRVPVKPVPGVKVDLGGTITATQNTPANGTYLFANIANGSNTVVSCSKSTPGNAGITAADLLLIQNHIFGQQFTSPYQWVAANANNSGGNNPITLADYLLIQRVVLGTDQNIQNSPDWKFIPKSYVFPTPNPLSVPFPQTITHNPAVMDFLNDDFVAVRMGDVNGNVTPTFTQEEVLDRSADIFKFRLEQRGFKNGDIITVPFKASDFTGRQAYQMTIAFDATVFALEDIQTGVLPGLTQDNFGTARLSEGYLSTVWVGRDPLTLQDDEVLFTLKFRALRSGKALSEVLSPGSQVTYAEAYDRDGKTMKVDFEFVHKANEADEFALYQNQPNPFRDITTISFRLPNESRATLRIFNASGQLVKTVVGEFAKGYNEVRFTQDELGIPGVYYYELETPERSDRKKMIIME